MSTRLGALVIIAAACTGAAVLGWQHRAIAPLVRQIRALRGEGDRVVRQRAENRRLAAALPSPEELDRLQADHAALPRLRAEIEALRAQVRATEEAAQQSRRFEAGTRVASNAWRNAGTATPNATLETVLWAAAGGDTEQFAHCLSIPEGRVRQRAISLLESLPSGIRARYGTPEQLIAFLAIKDVPLGAAEVVAWESVAAAAASAQVRLHLSSPDGETKQVMLRFANEGNGWKIVVPEAAIGRYAAILKARG